MLFDSFKMESSLETDFFIPKSPIFQHACATCSKIPSNIRSGTDYSAGFIHKKKKLFD